MNSSRSADGTYGWLRGHCQSWYSVVRLSAHAGWGLVTASLLLNLLIGVLPLGFVVATSVAIERASALGAAGPEAKTVRAVLAAVGVAVVSLLLQNALSPFQAAFGELVSRRADAQCAARLMRATLTDIPIARLEQPEVLDKLSDASRGLVEYFATPGAALAGFLALTARYAQLLGAVAIIVIAGGPLPGVLAAFVALIARFGSRGSLARWTVIIGRLARQRRRMRYIFDAGSAVAAAKDIRVLGTLPWWHARGESESDSYLRRLWQQRRRIYLGPYLLLSLVVLAGGVIVLIKLRDAGDAGTLSVLRLSAAVQALLIPLRFGAFFPEADVQTQYGMMAHDSMLAVQRYAASTGADTLPDMPLAKSSVAELTAGLPRNEVLFENVSFCYPGSDRRVLDGVSLAFPAGTSTAIVGLNGAGKTTLVKLLAQFYQPSGGRILVDGSDLAELSARSWQRRLAVIHQDYVRYELDAAANIGLGAAERIADRAALDRACAWAGADEVIDLLPDGLDTILSSRYQGGVDLSGGQWQRIALARALFAVEAGASVLVLDEPTAQLDVRAEVEFFDRFLELTQCLTTLVISHRFSTVRRADRIVVLEHGRVVEQGSHDELLALGGRYAELFWLQARRFSADGAPAGDLAGTPDVEMAR